MVAQTFTIPWAVILLVCAARTYAELFFYAHDYNSWASTVILYKETTINRQGGYLELNPYTNATVGRALYRYKFPIQNAANGSVASFNTSFEFSMNTDSARDFYGDGLAFLICPSQFDSNDLQVSSGGYLGMFNSSTNGLASNRVFAVEFDTHQNPPFRDPNDNHIGIDINSVQSWTTNDLASLGIVLNEGKRIICWIDYDGGVRHLWVYLAYSPATKPSSPAIEMDLDLAPYVSEDANVGFTSATGTRAELHTVYSWWFLTGFGNLTMPEFPSRRPLATLGERGAVITVFTLAVLVSFLCFFGFCARRRWQKQSKHLIDVLLPVACWMYWKESIAQEVRLKLATPSVELLAWLWRPRWVRSQIQPRSSSWPVSWLGMMILKRLPGMALRKRMLVFHYRRKAWEPEDETPKHGEPDGTADIEVLTDGEPVSSESSWDSGNGEPVGECSYDDDEGVIPSARLEDHASDHEEEVHQSGYKETHSRYKGDDKEAHLRYKGDHKEAKSRYKGIKKEAYSRYKSDHHEAHSRYKGDHKEVHSRYKDDHKEVHSRYKDDHKEAHSRYREGYEGVRSRYAEDHKEVPSTYREGYEGVQSRYKDDHKEVHSPYTEGYEGVQSRYKDNHKVVQSRYKGNYKEVQSRYKVIKNLTRKLFPYRRGKRAEKSSPVEGVPVQEASGSPPVNVSHTEPASLFFAMTGRDLRGGIEGEGFESYRISNASFIMVEDENQRKITEEGVSIGTMPVGRSDPEGAGTSNTGGSAAKAGTEFFGVSKRHDMELSGAQAGENSEGQDFLQGDDDGASSHGPLLAAANPGSAIRQSSDIKSDDHLLTKPMSDSLAESSPQISPQASSHSPLLAAANPSSAIRQSSDIKSDDHLLTKPIPDSLAESSLQTSRGGEDGAKWQSATQTWLFD